MENNQASSLGKDSVTQQDLKKHSFNKTTIILAIFGYLALTFILIQGYLFIKTQNFSNFKLLKSSNSNIKNPTSSEPVNIKSIDDIPYFEDQIPSQFKFVKDLIYFIDKEKLKNGYVFSPNKDKVFTLDKEIIKASNTYKSPDGKKIAYIAIEKSSGVESMNYYIYDLQKNEIIIVYKNMLVFFMPENHWSPDSNYITTAQYSGPGLFALKILDIKNKKFLDINNLDAISTWTKNNSLLATKRNGDTIDMVLIAIPDLNEKVLEKGSKNYSGFPTNKSKDIHYSFYQPTSFYDADTNSFTYRKVEIGYKNFPPDRSDSIVAVYNDDTYWKMNLNTMEKVSIQEPESDSKAEWELKNKLASSIIVKDTTSDRFIEKISKINQNIKYPNWIAFSYYDEKTGKRDSYVIDLNNPKNTLRKLHENQFSWLMAD